MLATSTSYPSIRGSVSRRAVHIYNAVRRVRFYTKAWSLGSKFQARIGFQEAAHRTTECTHWNALFHWYSRNSPEILFRCSLNPIADTTKASILPVEDEPLHHLAVALGTPNRFRIHAQTSGEGIGRS